MPSTGPAKNKSAGTGMKILWIPGRKKHHDKGVYKPTNHKIEHRHSDQKNEAWNLGGSKMHDEIATGGSDKDDKLDLINPTTPISCVLPSASLGVATTINADSCSESETETKLEKTDFDSIDRIDVLDGQPKLQHHTNGIKPKSKCKKTKEEKTVKCLYYTMMCCECTIS